MLWRALSLAVTLAVLAGCGFHLRGTTELPPVMARTAVVGIPAYSPLDREIAAALQGAGMRHEASPVMATALLRIHSERLTERVVGIDALGKASGHELNYHLVFSLQDASGTTLVEEQSVRLVRDQRVDNSGGLVAGGERQLLMGEMRRQAVDTMLRQIRARLMGPGSEPGAALGDAADSSDAAAP